MRTVLLLLLLVVDVSGCLDPGSEGDPKGIPPLRDFAAVYTNSVTGQQLAVELGPPRQILDADLDAVLAYPLRIDDVEADENALERTYWLSADLLVVRRDSSCSDTCGFDYADISWASRGHWPPLGIGFNTFVREGRTQQTLWGSPMDLAPDAKREGSTSVLTFTTINQGGRFQDRFDISDSYLSFDSTFEFEGDHVLPSRIATASGLTFSLVHYREGEPLPPVPALRDIGQTPPEKAWPGVWFPGSEVPLAGSSASVDDAMAAMQQNSTAFSHAVGQDCLLAIESTRTYLAGQNVNLDLTSTYSSQFSAVTYKALEASQTKWMWERNDSVLGQQWEGPETQSEPRPIQRPCEPNLPRPHVVHNASGHIRAAAEFPWETGKLPMMTIAFFDSKLQGCPCPELALRFQTGFGVPGQTGAHLLSFADEAPIVGLWFALGGTPDELERLEGGFGWPTSLKLLA